jgi:predicted Fe-Mo cluster-binding NifX family protein
MSLDAVLAIPSDLPGGLTAPRSGHFGRCDCFTVVEVVGGEVRDVHVIENASHAEGGCLGPVGLLGDCGTTAVIVAGIGGRPLQGLRAAGVAVYLDRSRALVSEVVEAFCSGDIAPIGDGDVCQG